MSLSTLAASATPLTSSPNLVRLCTRADLVAHSGVVAWHAGHQIAIFYLPGRPDAADGRSRQPEDAVDRSTQPEDVVASPLYKQHFRLRDGVCLEAPERRLQTWPVALHGDEVVLLEADARA